MPSILDSVLASGISNRDNVVSYILSNPSFQAICLEPVLCWCQDVEVRAMTAETNLNE